MKILINRKEKQFKWIGAGIEKIIEKPKIIFKSPRILQINKLINY
jgi:hypothetical protein